MTIYNKRLKVWITFIRETLDSKIFAEKTPSVYMLYGAFKEGYYPEENAMFLTDRIFGKANGMPKLTDEEVKKIKFAIDGYVIVSHEIICNGEVQKLVVQPFNIPSC